jgi:ABC-type lipopolysaccharide export system ATPase subunit
MLLGHLRIFPPPPGGIFPFLSPLSGPWRDPSLCVSVVSFAHRPRSSGGAFYDYTARYGAVREEDRITLRQHMFPDTMAMTINTENDFDDLADKLELKPLLDLPFVALSNGQTRRARILKSLLSKPELLLLDEPLSTSETAFVIYCSYINTSISWARR